MLSSAQVSVYRTETPATLASLFNADGTGKSNPVSVDANGRYSFYVDAGSYNLAVSSGGSVVTTLVNVGIVDPRMPHTTRGSNFEAPVRLSESTVAQPTGNSALRLERLDPAGARVGGPWSLHVNQLSGSDPTDLRWLYNVDWDEIHQTSTLFALPDSAFALRSTPRGAPAGNLQRFTFGFDYAPPPTSPDALPAWTTLFSVEQTSTVPLGDSPLLRLAGTGQTLVVGDGLPGIGSGLPASTLIARRYGWVCYRESAPAGVYSSVDDGMLLDCGVNCRCTICGCAPACDRMHPCPGDVVAPLVTTPTWIGAARTTAPAQPDATVYMPSGAAMLLQVGKALVRIEDGASFASGDVVVSSGVQEGRAMRDNSVTDPRRIIGFALEAADATLPGYVAIVRTSR